MVLPAYAGMIPGEIHVLVDGAGAPRIRGDDPVYEAVAAWVSQCSPHTRG